MTGYLAQNPKHQDKEEEKKGARFVWKKGVAGQHDGRLHSHLLLQKAVV